MSAPETNYEGWLAKAEHDLLNIENNLAAVQVPWDTVCFHAQQAAEKLLKAPTMRPRDSGESAKEEKAIGREAMQLLLGIED